MTQGFRVWGPSDIGIPGAPAGSLPFVSQPPHTHSQDSTIRSLDITEFFATYTTPLAFAPSMTTGKDTRDDLDSIYGTRRPVLPSCSSSNHWAVMLLQPDPDRTPNPIHSLLIMSTRHPTLLRISDSSGTRLVDRSAGVERRTGSYELSSCRSGFTVPEYDYVARSALWGYLGRLCRSI